ncbi:DUF2938 domain-containing protein [Chitinibacteraceae bacterium HSL-7]
MFTELPTPLYATALGVLATLVMDAVAWLRRRYFGVASLDYALLGRWVGHLPRGQLVHRGIGRSAPIAGERALGWATHYASGVALAAAFIVLAPSHWPASPALLPALIFGLVTVLLPFAIVQPGLGLGFAARLTPHPATARLRSLISHASFGLGLWLGGWVLVGVLRVE